MAFILYLDRICLGEIVKSASFKSEIPLNKEQIGTILGAFFFAYAIFQVPSGWASDRFGARPMLTIYIAGWSFMTALTGLAGGFWGLLLARLGCGIFEAGAYPTSGAVIRRWTPFSQRARASSLVAFGGRIGGTLAPLLTALMIAHFANWRPALWIDGLVGLLIAGFYWHIVRTRPEDHPRCNPAERAQLPSTTGEQPPSHWRSAQCARGRVSQSKHLAQLRGANRKQYWMGVFSHVAPNLPHRSQGRRSRRRGANGNDRTRVRHGGDALWRCVLRLVDAHAGAAGGQNRAHRHRKRSGRRSVSYVPLGH